MQSEKCYLFCIFSWEDKNIIHSMKGVSQDKGNREINTEERERGTETTAGPDGRKGSASFRGLSTHMEIELMA